MTMTDADVELIDLTDPAAPPPPARRRRIVRSVAMRPRRVLVKAHRWISFALLAWLFIISATGAWLAVHESVTSWFHSDRYAASPGDVGPQAALDAVLAREPDATVWSVTTPRNGRGVYIVGTEVPIAGAPEPAEGEEAPHRHLTFYVDPGTGQINDVYTEEAGATWWLYRGHMYLWQDWGLFGAFDPETGWCRAGADGAETGGVTGIVCDVLPDGMDMVAWFGLAWMVVLLSGIYLWYWPGVRRWATAFMVRRGRGAFTFNMSLHKVIGFVVWVPLTVIAFTGIAFAFPNMKGWYENVTPANRGGELWVPPEEAAVSGDAEGRQPITMDEFEEVLRREFPSRGINTLMPPFDETATYTAWVTRGFDPWTRENGAGNVLVSVDQYSGEVLDDATPEDGNAFDQAWSDWSFPLHTGDFGGTATRIVWVVVALSTVTLGTTGVVMNRIRAAKRARRKSRASEQPPVAV